MKIESITLDMDPKSLNEDCIVAGARAMSGIADIKRGKFLHWDDEYEPAEKDYYISLFKAGMIGFMLEAYRQQTKKKSK